MALSLANYIVFIRAQRIITGYTTTSGTKTPIVVTISAIDLPDNSAEITASYNLALEIVAKLINQFSATIYEQCIYNLAFHMMLFISNNAVFDSIKLMYKVLSLRVGVLGSTSDEGTSVSYQAIPAYLQNITGFENDLQKTPWGRVYFNYAMMYRDLSSFG